LLNRSNVDHTGDRIDLDRPVLVVDGGYHRRLAQRAEPAAEKAACGDLGVIGRRSKR